MSQDDSNLANENDDLPDVPGKTAPKAAAPKPEPIAPLPVEEPEPTKQKHSDYLRRVANEFGFPQTDIDTLTSDQLWSEVNHLRDLQHAEYERANRGKQAVPTKGASVAPSEPEVDPLDAFDKEDAYTPEVKALASEVKRLRKIAEKVDVLEKNETHRQGRTIEDAIDAAFEPLEKDHADLIGEGTIAELTQSNKAAVDNRVFVYRAAGIVNSDTPAQIKRKITAAFQRLQAFGGSKSATPAPAKPSKNGYEQQPSAERLQAGQVAMPTARSGAAEPKGVARAKQVLHARMSANGDQAGRLDEDDDNSDLVD